MGNMVKGHPDPRKKKVTRDGMTPITRMERGKVRNKPDNGESEYVEQLIEYEWPEG